MKLRDIGEFGLIYKVTAPFMDELPEGWTGVGDDCAVIPTTPGRVQVVTTDMLVENTHFILANTTPEDLGYKALAVNLSDIAATGATPRSAFISLAIPTHVEVEWISRFYAGLHELATQSGTLLLGGDTTRSPGDLVISITIFGEMAAADVKLRSLARPGDLVCLSGTIGDSPAGLRLLLDGVYDDTNPDHRALARMHHRPRPHLEEGLWLAFHPAIHGMMDVSDGIDSDLRRIMEQAKVGMEIHLDALPISPQLQRVCREQGWDAAHLAATGGEDYCLVCTIDAQAFPRISQDFSHHFGTLLKAIGRVTSQPETFSYTCNGAAVTLAGHGFDHFT